MVESLCVRIKGKANKADVVVGVYYQLPSQGDNTNELSYKELRDISRSAALVLMGDFNFPDINWEYPVDGYSRKFLKHVEDNFLLQVLSELTRILLDLLFVNREGLMGKEVIEFQIIGDRRKIASKTSTLDMGRADFRLLKELVSKVPWESAFEGIGVHECWSLVK
ncbi:hypothetical protein GRJ2_002790300 [Grus japonensis]|uniref:Endonuclease/exonuclease/phosphatase domain-containing protein n=1 Tax=Grus japonensis TaxID=30415 RepID=A0ABC9Y351_GRUJA